MKDVAKLADSDSTKEILQNLIVICLDEKFADRKLRINIFFSYKKIYDDK